nr:MAG TPA: Major capsid protein [Microviridae sp.]
MDDMPTFCGAVSSDILFEDIRATTSAKVGDADQYLGDKGSSAIGYGDSRRFNIVADRPGYVMAIATLVPRVDYYQFTERYALHGKLSDSFMPEYNGIGYQDVLIGDLNSEFPPAWDSTKPYAATSDPFANSVGKQPAWVEYMTAVNKVRGSFCSTEKSWVLARDMRVDNTSSPITPPTQATVSSAYIDPGDWNQPFADQSVTAQNFYAQFYIRDRVRSTVLKRLRPKF